MSTPRTAEAVAAAIEMACRLEVTAPKPGNVSPTRPFGNMRYEDFLLSAAAIAPILADTSLGLGATIHWAVVATRRRVSANTNLGIVLLLTPIARAARSQPGPLRPGVKRVLEATTVADAEEVYRAILLARPGGLGKVGEQDLSQAPTVTLLNAMRLAAGRDAIAAEYASGFQRTFESAMPGLRRARHDGLSWDDAIVEVYLSLLAASPDTLIARKHGVAAARQVSDQATEVIQAGGVRTAPGRGALAAFDASLADPHNSRNPGSTADLLAAGLLVLLLLDGLP
ncbi:MAG TPA: triphosphoribosyl-dephospho-CoA synthase [Gemmatimonadales bacterium]|nr:triphosphoribosyl-dephospho-CoA synthase [Gemmatimonadales bacterium]